MKRIVLNFRILSILTLTITLPMLLFWGVIYNYISHILYERSSMQFGTVCENISTQVENAVSSAENLSKSLLLDSTAVLMSTRYYSPDYLALKKYSDGMKVIADSTPYIKGIFSYFPGHNLIVSSFSTFSPIEYFYDTFFILDDLDKNDFIKYLSDNINFRPKVYSAYCGVDVPKKQASDVIMYLAGEYKTLAENRPTVVGVLIDLSYFLNMLDVYPVDKITMKAETLDPSELSFNTEGAITKIIIADKKDYLIFQKSVKGIRLTFIVPFDNVIGDINKPLFLFSGILSIMIVLILASIYYYFYRIFRPINRMYVMFNNIEASGRSFFDNELKVIEAGIGALKTEQEHAVSVIRRFSENLKQHYLSVLLSEPSSTDISNAMLALRLAGCDLSRKLFLCCVLHMKDNNDILKQFMLNFKNGSPSVFMSRNNDNGFIDIIVNADGENEIFDLFDTLQDAVAELTSFYFLGMGTVVNDLSALHMSRQAALEELHIAINNEEVFGNDFLEKYKLEMYNNLFNGNMKYAKNALDKMLEVIFEKSALNDSSLRDFYIQLLPLIKSSLRKPNEKLDALCNKEKLEKLVGISDMMHYISKLFIDITDENQKLSGNSRLKSKFLEYINMNIFDPSLSLSSVAEALMVHKVYLSNHIKKNFGCGFVDIVATRRIEAALKYFDKPEYSIVQIAELSGYGSEVTFRRDFKRIVGMTPSMYRKTCNHNNGG